MFDIKTADDFYAVLVADFDDFMDEPHSGRRALHCAITAYHLHEWIWGDWLKGDHVTRNTLGISDKKSFLEWIDRNCVWFANVQELANGSKHFIRNQGFETELIGGYGRGPYGVGPYGQGYLLIDYGENAGNHRWRPAADLLEVVVRFWRDFLRLYRPTLTVPPSRHHVD
jgi:hypothetical protein